MGLFIGLAIVAVVTFCLFRPFSANTNDNSQNQSAVFREKICAVCKFITVVADFAEIYYYQNVKEKIANFLVCKKKAIVLINARAYIGCYLSKIRWAIDTVNTINRLTEFPQQQLLSIEKDFNYYDKSKVWANYFTSDDLTEVIRNAKQHIIDKVPESGLMEQAHREELNTIQLMEGLAETIGWKLDYTALILDKAMDTKKLSSNGA
jgi:hypothetical protein